MVFIHCHACICLSNTMLECISPAKRFPPKATNEKKILFTQQIQKSQKRFCNEDKNKPVVLQIKMHLKNITKIKKYKKTEVQCIKE